MAFRRKRPLVAWLPNLGTVAGDEEDDRLSGIAWTMGVADTGALTNLIIPLTFDLPIDEASVAATTSTLADFEGSAYRLRRVVGTFQAARSWSEDPAGLPIVLGAGLAVVAWDPFSDTPEAQPNPLSNRDIRDAWIWRRTWTLGLQQNQVWGSPSGFTPLNALPTNTSFYPQNRGEFVDQKTARVIGGDERLCLVLGSASFIPYVGAPQLAGYFDYRILASLQRRSNKRNTRVG